MLCIYHNDLDGKCAAAIVNYKYPDCKMLEMDYKNDYNLEEIAKEDKIFILDFALQPLNQMLKLWEINKNVVWIDHHKSNIDFCTINTIVNNINGIREIGKSGCELTWEYLFPERKIPLTVKLLGRYDVYDFTDDRTLPFQYGMRLLDTKPNSEEWKVHFHKYIDLTVEKYIEYIQSIVDEGNIVLKYISEEDELYCKQYAFPMTFEGYNCVVLNRGLSNVKVFDSRSKDYQIMIAYVFDGRKYAVSLYTIDTTIDVSAIAKKYKGGGHKSAAGFVTEKLPWG